MSDVKPSELPAKLREADLYLNNLWSRAQILRDQQTGSAHAALNELRHAIGAIPDVLLPAAQRIEALEEALSAMVANESMVEAAHKRSGSPYFNSALEKARAALQAPAGET